MEPDDVLRRTLTRLCALETLQTPTPPDLLAEDRRRLALALRSVSPIPMQLSPIADQTRPKKTVRFRLPEAAEAELDQQAAKPSFWPPKLIAQLPLDMAGPRM